LPKNAGIKRAFDGGDDMKRLFICLLPLLVAMLAAMAAPAAAQEARPAAEAGAKLLENEQIRVRELRLKAGETIPAQARPNTFLYALTDGDLVFVPPGRTPYELSFKAGEALWLPAQEAATRNESGKDIRALLVEIKQRPPAPAKAKGSAKGKAGSKAKSKGAKPAAQPAKAKAKSK
jgi:hypothetical protein